MNAKYFTRTLILAGLMLTGCLPSENTGTTAETGGSLGNPNPDFQTQPDPVTTPPVVPVDPPVIPEVDEDGISLNGGAVATKSIDLYLRLYKFEGIEMKISHNSTCEGGEWQPYATELEFSLPNDKKNRVYEISAQFTDYDNKISKCFATHILHDDLGPDILFAKYPTVALKDNEATEIIYEVSDAGVGVASVECKLNGLSRACSAGRTIVSIPGAAPGTYIFEVIATDHFGTQNQKAVSWQVLEDARRLTQTIKVDEYRKWDILFIIDNSGSMEYEQRNMGERTRNFLAVMRGLDWQIAITTTDPSNKNYGDGRFLPLTGGSGYILNSTSVSESDAQTILSKTLQRTEMGSGLEQGIFATYRAVERAATAGSVHANFFREGAHFAVVLISDEDESANTFRNDPQNLMNLIAGQFNGQKNFLFNSIITIPGDRHCIDGEGERYGERFKMMTDLTKGVIGSVCAGDYGAQMTGIGEKVRGMAQSFTLSCQPLPEYGVVVKRDGVVSSSAFTIDGVKLSFASAIEPGNYEIDYSCMR